MSVLAASMALAAGDPFSLIRVMGTATTVIVAPIVVAIVVSIAVVAVVVVVAVVSKVVFASPLVVALALRVVVVSLVPIAVVAIVVVAHSLVNGVESFAFLCDGLEGQNGGNCVLLSEASVLV